ncbi:YcaO-like family protein [Sulfuricurvum sp.]|uniref:YcaO-like family protein n=1 Tax=Sulfuricurvum sp. TaxID=2025608 RepID=UPI002639A837|nr:YcaO-like family protein [Sulfuricurvum sp.]MDD2266264.1 YcaO-like family protein [Sulfuricurvum sp.]MDD2783312.1 YcaO-like family protein [Sulfuricurvum sp.]
MNLVSKNAPVEVSIKRMEKILSEMGCAVTYSSEKHPLNHCYSVNLASVEAPKHIYSNGKGIYSEASTASALGEYIERLQTNNFFIDFHLPKRKYYPDEVAFEFGKGYLNSELMEIYDPKNELSMDELLDFNSDYEDKIVALPFKKLSGDEVVYFPLNILSNLYVSNGLATGNTAQEAQVQSMSEILERYAKIEIIKNGYSLPHYEDVFLQQFERLYSDLMKLRELGYIVNVLDASLGGKYPVTAISFINPANATLFVSFGAHPILEVSLERTMTELMQGRGLENLEAFEVPTFDMSIVSESFNLESHFIDSNGKMGIQFLSSKKSFELASWNYTGSSTAEEFAYLTEIFASMEKELYIREYDYLDMYSCQIIVPGVSEVYPIDDLIYNNRNRGKVYREAILNFADYDPDSVLDEIEALEDHLNVEKFIGVIFEENFTIGELKAQLHLSLGNVDEAVSYLEFSTNTMSNLVVELIQMEKLGLEFGDYRQALYDLYTQERVDKAVGIVSGEHYLVNTMLHRDYHNMLEMYDRLEVKKRVLLQEDQCI